MLSPSLKVLRPLSLAGDKNRAATSSFPFFTVVPSKSGRLFQIKMEHIRPHDLQLALRGLVETPDQVKKGRLTASGRSHKGDERSRFDLKGDVTEGPDGDLPHLLAFAHPRGEDAVNLGDILSVDQSHGFSFPIISPDIYRQNLQATFQR